VKLESFEKSKESWQLDPSQKLEQVGYRHSQKILDRDPAPDPEAPSVPFWQIKLVLAWCGGTGYLFYHCCSKVVVFLLSKKSKKV
jgi:hypothetical protein